MMISRIAPTPSGFLHIGNLYAFILTTLIVQKNKGTLWLRIDDLDKARVRDSYLENIFKTLDWVGIKVDKGPSSVAEFKASFSQHLFLADYQKALQEVQSTSSIYPCICSRKTLHNRISNPSCYDGFCLHSPVQNPTDANLRIDTSKNGIIKFDDFLTCNTCEADINTLLKDFIIWKKDGLPSYQFASVIDDIRLGINTIIRGEDLMASTIAQLYLKNHHPIFQSLPTWNIHHHPLIKNINGEKISKSTLHGNNNRPLSQQYSKREFWKVISSLFNLPTHTPINSLDELFKFFQDNSIFPTQPLKN